MRGVLEERLQQVQQCRGVARLREARLRSRVWSGVRVTGAVTGTIARPGVRGSLVTCVVYLFVVQGPIGAEARAVSGMWNGWAGTVERCRQLECGKCYRGAAPEAEVWAWPVHKTWVGGWVGLCDTECS